MPVLRAPRARGGAAFFAYRSKSELKKHLQMQVLFLCLNGKDPIPQPLFLLLIVPSIKKSVNIEVGKIGRFKAEPTAAGGL